MKPIAEVLQKFEPVIGMEVHAQLATRSKMFCACPTDSMGAPPNSVVCPVCLGLPGVLPNINRRAVELCVRSALALNCEIAEHTRFDRKNYFYPDLPKGYQISQYDLPMSRNGWIDVGDKRIRITRVHLEEDTGKLAHAGDRLHSAGSSNVDLNRAGTPLMEIVTEADLRSAAEARDYAMAIRGILRAIGASDAEMEKGHLRAEANVSIRPLGQAEFGVKTELKNINSFRALFRAVEFEIRRQAQVLESGGQVVQETRGWSEPEQRTYSQRSKEGAEDYRYFPEPDLPPLTLARAWVEEVRGSLPELPAARRTRFVEQLAIPLDDARLLSADPQVGDYFEALVAGGVAARDAAKWMVAESLQRDDPLALPVSHMAELLGMLARGEINRDQARAIEAESLSSGRSPAEAGAGVRQVSDTDELAEVVESVMTANPQAVSDLRSGKQQAIGVLVRAAREATSGRANPKVITEMILARLSRD